MKPIELLSPRDAGRRLGLTTSGIRRLADVGQLSAIRDSAGRRLFLAEDVDRFVAERAMKAEGREAA